MIPEDPNDPYHPPGRRSRSPPRSCSRAIGAAAARRWTRTSSPPSTARRSRSQQIDTQLAQMKKTSPQTFEGTQGVTVEAEYRAKILDSLIQLELVKQAAKTLGVERHRQAGRRLRQAARDAVRRQGRPRGRDEAVRRRRWTSSRSRSRNRLLVEARHQEGSRRGSPKVTDAQIKAYYDANKASFSVPVEVDAQHILFKTADKKIAETVLRPGRRRAATSRHWPRSTRPTPAARTRAATSAGRPPRSTFPSSRAAVDAMKKGEVRLVAVAVRLARHQAARQARRLDQDPRGGQGPDQDDPRVAGAVRQLRQVRRRAEEEGQDRDPRPRPEEGRRRAADYRTGRRDPATPSQ